VQQELQEPLMRGQWVQDLERAALALKQGEQPERMTVVVVPLQKLLAQARAADRARRCWAPNQAQVQQNLLLTRFQVESPPLCSGLIQPR
jgi:hypothetical protein